MPNLLVTLRPELLHHLGWIKGQEDVAVAVPPDGGPRHARAVEDLLGRMPSAAKPAKQAGNGRADGGMAEEGEIPQPVAAELAAGRQGRRAGVGAQPEQCA